MGSAVIVQAPVNLTVGATPLRAGSYPGGYQIINKSLDATVWAASNPSVSDGTGTPIYPGTSLIWESSGDLWLILGTDGQSVKAGSAGVTLSYDVTGWQPNPVAIATAVLNSGVIVVDNPTPLMSISATGPGVTTLIDISRYQSLNMSIILNTPTAGVDYIYLEFSDGGVTTYRVPLVFQDAGQLWTASIPCYGSGFRIRMGTAANLSFFVSGSYRPIDTIKQRIEEVNNFQPETDILWTTGSLANGAITQWNLPPWHGELQIYAYLELAAAAAPGLSNVGVFKELVAYENFLILPFSIVGGAATGTRHTCTGTVQTNGDGLQVRMFNGSGVNWTKYVLRITPNVGAAVGT